MSRRTLTVLILLFLGLALYIVNVQAATPLPVTVYYNRACADCLHYIEEMVVPLLHGAGYAELVYKDYINEPENRAELLERSSTLGVPPDLQSHLTVFVGERLVLEGHIPEQVVADLLAAPSDAFERMLVYQDKMSGATEYVAWAFRGEPQTYPINAPIGEYLAYLEEHGERRKPAARVNVEEERNLLPLVLTTGFLDGLNPCAFAVKDYFFPQLPIHLRIPTIAHGTIEDWLRRATFPAAAVGGFLVGLCTFPCSGGIYVAIVGLLAAQTTRWQGVGYLGLYNLAFIAPLLIILAGVANRRVMHHIRLAERSSRRWVRLATGLGMVAVGAVILIWFV